MYAYQFPKASLLYPIQSSLGILTMLIDYLNSRPAIILPTKITDPFLIAHPIIMDQLMLMFLAH